MENENKIELSLDEITMPQSSTAPEAPAPPQFTELEKSPITAVTEAAFVAAPEVVKADSSKLTEEERRIVADFAQKIDVRNSTQILQYGGQAQKKISAFSEQALVNVRAKDMDEIGGMITDLVVQLKNFEIEDKGKKPGLFKKQKDKMALTKAKYDTVEKNIDRICGVLENHKITLLKDVHMLDQMYEKNLEYFKELSMYIIAGRQKLEEIIEKDLPALQEKAVQSGLAEDAQEANYLADMCNRFDKKLHDLELTRIISVQMSPQIRMVQSTNNIMVEKIQSSLVNTIPLWKNQMVLALGMSHSQAAIKAQREVTDVTNALLKKNADMLKQNTVEAAKESERSIVDIETLKYTNQSLITTLDEVLRIQQDGKTKRREAEAELVKIEDELKTKLLDIRDAGKPPVVEAEVVNNSGLTLDS